MHIRARRVEYQDVQLLHELYRQEANCQIVHDSFLVRNLADPYLILVHDELGGYGAVSNKYGKGRLIEFYTLPHLRRHALSLFRELWEASGATHIEAQTNIPWMLSLLYDCAKNIAVEKVLFHDALDTNLACPGGLIRHSTTNDDGADPNIEWVIEMNGDIVGKGGFLCHYNPPYGDIYMDVAESFRRQGFGSYLVQELKRVCYRAGKKPAARCDPGNIASRRTLEKAGLLPCGHILVGKIKPPQALDHG